MEFKEAKNRFQAILKTKDFNALEDFWIDLLSTPNILSQLNQLLEIIRPLTESYPDKARLFLDLLKENIKSTNDDTKTLQVLKEIARISDTAGGVRNKIELRKEIADCYRRLYRNSQNLDNFIRKSELLENRQILSAMEWLENILAFDVSNFVYSNDYGLGQVTEVDFLLDRLLVDFFNGKKSYFPFTPTTLSGLKEIRPLAKDNFLVLKQIAPEVLRKKAKTDPLALFQLLLKSVPKALKVKEIKELLSNIINENDWERFWEKVKQLANNDPNILITTAPERTYTFCETKIEKKSVSKVKSKTENAIISDEPISSLNQDEIIKLVLEQKNLTTIKRLLKMIRLNRTHDWWEIYSRLFFVLKDKRILMTIGPELVNSDNTFLKKIFNSYRSYPIQFLWLLTTDFGTEFSFKALLARLLDIFTIADLRTYWNEALKCLKANHWAILQKALTEMSAIDVQKVWQTIKNLSGLKDFEKVEIKKLIEAAFGATDTSDLAKIPDVTSVIYSTAEGIRKREQELKELLTVAIPQSAKEIGRAREFGDLSENYEYKAAKEKQARLVAKVEALRAELRRARPINFATVATDVVRIGTKVTLAELENGKKLTITILGPYDIDLAKGIISYLAPIAKDLLGKRVGDVVTIKSDEQTNKQYQIVAIEQADR